MPVRLIPREKLTPQDKLVLAFDALVLAAATGHAPPVGKIIYGGAYAVANVKLEAWLPSAQAVLDRIPAQQASRTPPPLVLNTHCAACEFQAHCRQMALEKDDLSLLSGMTAKEMKKQHSKGIFRYPTLLYLPCAQEAEALCLQTRGVFSRPAGAGSSRAQDLYRRQARTEPPGDSSVFGCRRDSRPGFLLPDWIAIHER
jgi:hypothetical protein